MATAFTPPSTASAITIADPVFSNPEQLALAGFLAGYTGLTREANALDLRQYASCCQQHHVRLFDARRADIVLDRNELGALLVAAGLGTAAEHALVSLLALNGLRVSEANHRRRRGYGPRARAPDADYHPQGRQGRQHPARPADRAGDRPDHRRALRRTDLPHPRWPPPSR
jgi:hypothetical protein